MLKYACRAMHLQTACLGPGQNAPAVSFGSWAEKCWKKNDRFIHSALSDIQTSKMSLVQLFYFSGGPVGDMWKGGPDFPCHIPAGTMARVNCPLSTSLWLVGYQFVREQKNLGILPIELPQWLPVDNPEGYSDLSEPLVATDCCF